MTGAGAAGVYDFGVRHQTRGSAATGRRESLSNKTATSMNQLNIELHSLGLGGGPGFELRFHKMASHTCFHHNSTHRLIGYR